ncbi:MAG: hypothetical protein JWP89_6258 [Schlesneria sp.]|nr:hypothetical protein [Schlesneria sp.]
MTILPAENGQGYGLDRNAGSVARLESSKGVGFRAPFMTTPFAKPQSVPPKLKIVMALRKQGACLDTTRAWS